MFACYFFYEFLDKNFEFLTSIKFFLLVANQNLKIAMLSQPKLSQEFVQFQSNAGSNASDKEKKACHRKEVPRRPCGPYIINLCR